MMKAIPGLLVTLLSLVAAVGISAKATGVRLTIFNEVDEDLAVYWVNTWSNGALVRQKEGAIISSSSFDIQSFFNHSFLVVEQQHVEGLTAYHAKMWNPKNMAFFTMGEFDIEAHIWRNDRGDLEAQLESVLTRTATRIATASEKCRSSLAVSNASPKQRAFAEAEGSFMVSAAKDPDEASSELTDCITKAVAEIMARMEDGANKNMKMLGIVGKRARDYTCDDPDMKTTETSLTEHDWLDPTSGTTHHVKVFLDEPDATILLLDEFASDAECKALVDHAMPHMKAAAVDVGGGKSRLSQARRAKSSGVPADLNNPASITADLYRRGYAFANNATGYDLHLPGQEGFNVVNYGPDDEYRPHCDGDCTGAVYRPGGRVATMVIYCEQAKIGGGTTFSSSDIFVKGKKGQAVFFSYLGPDNRTDKGRTRHSGCPIVEGTKWIATLWMRKGVTAERDWEYYDLAGWPSSFAQAQMAGRGSTKDAAGLKVVDNEAKTSETETTRDERTTVNLQQDVEDGNCATSLERELG